MLSMCGLICRFFHGWRQTEAVATMRQVAILPQMSLLVERCDHIVDPDRVKAIYCQPLCGIVVKKQLLWRESNKQVLTVTPKETHNLMRWTRFDSGSDDQGIVAATNAKTMLSTTTHSINEITIILEASYSSMSAENIPSNCITVSDLADLYAWKSMEAFEIIIKTTPAELVAMIHAFFTDSLFLEDNLQICRMSTVDITGIPTVKPKAADQTYTDNVKQIVHNLENQIQNVAPGNESRPATPLVEEDESGQSCGSCEVLGKPPNILVYAGDNEDYYQDVKDTLLEAVNDEKYVVYHLKNDMVYQQTWRTHSALLVICGDVNTHIDTVFIRHLLEGGQILSICSDFLKFAVPLYGNVEFAEAAVVSLSYGKWKNVQLLHHKHCFHTSPKHVRSTTITGSSAVSVEPSMVEIKDDYGQLHKISLQVLATDNTWGAPALLLADVNGRSGKAVFSQVHLEKNPQTGISDNLRACHLEQSNDFRLQILKDLLGSHFHLDITAHKQDGALTPAYVIGDKSQLLNCLAPYTGKNGTLQRPGMNLCFTADTGELVASENILPVITNSIPANFSVEKYLQTLKTTRIGRVAIYCDVITSTMDVLEGDALMAPGCAVFCSRQTKGKGRSGNDWLSPRGCVLMSVQLHIPRDSPLGKRMPFLQHIVSMAACQAVKQYDAYKWMPLRLKWPNDVYMGEETKIGGVLVTACMPRATHLVKFNVGLGVNLDNTNPTTCINDEIRKRNEKYGTQLVTFDLETYTAELLNCLEQLVEKYQSGGSDAIFDTYYSLWLHSNAKIKVKRELQPDEPATVTGIDEFGFLVARLESGHVITLHPDGNSFDVMQGLVYQK